jgi:hypothetical protein
MDTAGRFGAIHLSGEWLFFFVLNIPQLDLCPGHM